MTPENTPHERKNASRLAAVLAALLALVWFLTPAGTPPVPEPARPAPHVPPAAASVPVAPALAPLPRRASRQPPPLARPQAVLRVPPGRTLPTVEDILKSLEEAVQEPLLSEEAEWKGHRSGINALTTFSIRDTATWDRFRKKFKMPPGWRADPTVRDPRLKTPPPELPGIDFSKMMVVGVCLGKVRQGWMVEIKKLRLGADGQSLTVGYRKNLPLPNPMQGPGFTEPFHIKVIRKLYGPVSFRQRL